MFADLDPVGGRRTPDGGDGRVSPLDPVLASPEFIADPYPTYRLLRDEHPLYWSAHWRVWVLSRYEDIQAVLRDSHHFSSSGRFNALLEMLPPDEVRALLPLARFGRAAWNRDPPDHTRLRRLFRDAFTPAVIESLRPRVHMLVDELLDAAATGSDEFDLIRGLALPLPVGVVSELLGATDEERAGFEGWATALLDFLAVGRTDIALARRAAQGLVEMERRFAEMLEDRRRQPRDDLLTSLAMASQSDGIAADELPLIAAELMIAGHHTTKDLIANAVITFARQPEALAAVDHAPARFGDAVEEVLRYESSIQRGWRRVAADVVLYGQQLRAGELVFLMLGAANRDPAQFPDPDRFDVTRTPNRHLAFGYGIHLCVGAPLARLEAPIALEALYRRFPRVRPTSDLVDWYPSIHIRGPRHLPVALDGR